MILIIFHIIKGTGPEIWEQTSGKITHFFTGAGTGSTITGTGKFLKEKNNKIHVVAVQAQRNHLLQGLRNFEESAKPELFLRREEVVDDWYTATNEKSFRRVKEIALNENMLVGPSSGFCSGQYDGTSSRDYGEGPGFCGHIC